jgi:hypothetical protein
MSEDLNCPQCNQRIPGHGCGDYKCPDCGMAFQIVVLTPEQVSQLELGPIRHETLPPKLMDDIKQSYNVVGKYLYPTLEQWEVGFLRDAFPAREVHVWAKISLAFMDYHQKRGLESRDRETEVNLVGRLIEVSTGYQPDDDEGKFIRECYLNAGKV